MLAERGDYTGAITVLRPHIDAGHSFSADRLADQLVTALADQGDPEEADRIRRFGLSLEE
ncbi:hypothetical protein HS041_36120 [Planomonospora sp. ID67723]|uniref:hypothetical protein n=1 Tax=Planomonospora sp. ID67723 TaxID=2738134 RepID=UPI0018C3B9F1|nr:hypothetical protein [Planomonospora sp. ID67723]MBG0833133.1 hypothetical protein [Planomonospora sp. ID67723]